jgi:hypothetical protein
MNTSHVFAAGCSRLGSIGNALFAVARLKALPTLIDAISDHFVFRVMADDRHLMQLPSTLQTVA